MTTLYLIRHAEAEGNLYRRMHGHTDGMVTPTGMDQIKALAERFKSIHVDACYASDLLRTRTTAQAVCIPNHIPLYTDAGFREMYLGVWEDMPFGQCYVQEPEAMHNFIHAPEKWHVDGSETFQEYTDRFLNTLQRVAKAHDGQSVAVVTHSGILQGVVMRLFPGQPLGLCPNTSVTKIEYENGQYRLIYLYDGSHLEGKTSSIGGKNLMKEDLVLWFRPGLTAVEGLEPPKAEVCYTALSGQTPVGVVCMEPVDEKTGRLTYIGLLPQWRGKGVSVQLLGKAVYHFRAEGKTQMYIQMPHNNVLHKLFDQMQLTADENGLCTMDIRLQMLSL